MRIPRLQSINITGLVLSVLVAMGHAARTPVEGVAAVVDGTPILFSDVEELRQAMASQRPAFEAQAVSEQRKEVLARLIDEKILVARAKQDTTLKVSDKDADAKADEWYGRVVQQQGGEKQLELALKQATGMSLGQFKARIKDQTRDQMYRQKLQMKFVGDPDPSQLQVREFFEKYRDSLPVQHDGVRLSHIQWRIKANNAIDSTARAQAQILITRLDKGESFAELAKDRSDDFSGKDGGDLGYTKRGTLDPDYERAAYVLDAGDYTAHPVKTRFGYHIIRLTARKDNEIRTSHILIKVIPSAEDTVRAHHFLDSVGQALKTEQAFRSAARSFSEDRQTREMGGDLGWFQHDSLNSAYKEVVDSLPEGGISGAVLIGDSYHLFRLDRKVSERHLTLEEDYATISQYAKELLISQKLSSLLEKWRDRVSVESRIAQFKSSEESPDAEAGDNSSH